MNSFEEWHKSFTLDIPGYDLDIEDANKCWQAAQRAAAKRCIELALNTSAGHYDYIEDIQKEFLDES